MTRKNDAERQEAIGKLREWVKPGDTVYTRAALLDAIEAADYPNTTRDRLENLFALANKIRRGEVNA